MSEERGRWEVGDTLELLLKGFLLKVFARGISDALISHLWFCWCHVKSWPCQNVTQSNETRSVG